MEGQGYFISAIELNDWYTADGDKTSEWANDGEVGIPAEYSGAYATIESAREAAMKVVDSLGAELIHPDAQQSTLVHYEVSINSLDESEGTVEKIDTADTTGKREEYEAAYKHQCDFLDKLDSGEIDEF